MLKANFLIDEIDGEIEVREKTVSVLREIGADENTTLPFLLSLMAVESVELDQLQLTPEQRIKKVQEAIHQIIIKGSEIRPLILIFEDLHWIDRSSEEIMKSVLDIIPGIPVLLIFSYRPEYVHSWGGKSYHSQVTLNRLSNRESLEMLTYLLSTNDVEKDLQELVLSRTEGIPFFIEETVKSLIELKIIDKKNNYRLAKNIQDLTIPSSIQDVILARVDTLPEPAREILQNGSVIEREFDYKLIKEVTDQSEKDLMVNFSVLRDSELIYERGILPNTTYIFKHALTQEVIYNNLLISRKKEIHQKVAQSIEESNSGDLVDYYEILAHHYSKTENLEKAFEFSKLSGEKALENYSHKEAVSFFQQALTILDKYPKSEQNDRSKIKIYLSMHNTYRFLGYSEDILKMLQEGEKLSMEIGDEKSQILFSTGIGTYYTSIGQNLRGRNRLEESHRKAVTTGNLDLIVPITLSLARSYINSGEEVKALEIIPGVIDLIEKTGRKADNFGQFANAYSYLCAYYGISCTRLGKLHEADEMCEKSLRNAKVINDKAAIGSADYFLGFNLAMQGDSERAIKHFQECIDPFEETKYTVNLGQAWTGMGMAYYQLGDFNKALELGEKGLRLQSDTTFTMDLPLHYSHLSLTYFKLNDLEKALFFAEKSLDTSIKNGEKYNECYSCVRLGYVSGKKGSPMDTVEEHIFEGIKMSEDRRYIPLVSEGYFSLGDLYLDAELQDKAFEYLTKSESLSQEIGTDYLLKET